MYTVLRTVRGSVTYGMELSEDERKAAGLPASDVDYMHVVAAPLQEIFSTRRIFEVCTRTDPDEEIHELRHFLHLCTKANPNILECLAVEERFVTHITPAGQVLRDHIHLFLNRRPLSRSHYGYIDAQLRRYVLHTPGENTQRAPAIARFGFDTKAAAHCVRLLNTGIDALRTGRLVVYRPERRLLKDIRLGKLSREEVLALIEERKAAFREAEAESTLPDEPDREAIDALYRKLAGMIYGPEIARALLVVAGGEEKQAPCCPPTR